MLRWVTHMKMFAAREAELKGCLRRIPELKLVLRCEVARFFLEDVSDSLRGASAEDRAGEIGESPDMLA